MGQATRNDAELNVRTGRNCGLDSWNARRQDFWSTFKRRLIFLAPGKVSRIHYYEARECKSACTFDPVSAPMGRTEESLRLVDRSVSMSQRTSVALYYEALARLKTPDQNGALDALEEAVATNEQYGQFIDSDPDLQPLRDSERFARLLPGAGADLRTPRNRNDESFRRDTRTCQFNQSVIASPLAYFSAFFLTH